MSSVLPKVIQYADKCSQITKDQKLIVIAATSRSEKWRDFIASNPYCKSEWFNEIVDWLIKEYPHEFVLKK